MAGVPLWHLAVGYIFPALIYWIARQSVLSEHPVISVQAFLAIFGVYLALTGILETAGQWSMVYPRYIADPNVGLHYGRARGPMVQSVSYGLYLGICLVALLIWQLQFGRGGKLASILLAPILMIGVFLTLTRSVWMGTARGAFRSGGTLASRELAPACVDGHGWSGTDRRADKIRRTFGLRERREFGIHPFVGREPR